MLPSCCTSSTESSCDILLKGGRPSPCSFSKNGTNEDLQDRRGEHGPSPLLGDSPKIDEVEIVAPAIGKSTVPIEAVAMFTMLLPISHGLDERAARFIAFFGRVWPGDAEENVSVSPISQMITMHVVVQSTFSVI